MTLTHHPSLLHSSKAVTHFLTYTDSLKLVPSEHDGYPEILLKSTRHNSTTHWSSWLTVWVWVLPRMGFRRYWLIKLENQAKRVQSFLLGSFKKNNPQITSFSPPTVENSPATNWDPEEEKITSIFSSYIVLGILQFLGQLVEKWQTNEIRFAI